MSPACKHAMQQQQQWCTAQLLHVRATWQPCCTVMPQALPPASLGALTKDMNDDCLLLPTAASWPCSCIEGRSDSSPAGATPAPSAASDPAALSPAGPGVVQLLIDGRPPGVGGTSDSCRLQLLLPDAEAPGPAASVSSTPMPLALLLLLDSGGGLMSLRQAQHSAAAVDQAQLRVCTAANSKQQRSRHARQNRCGMAASRPHLYSSSCGRNAF